ncbi:prepilin-type N-terminal cleavage/methylation domain-containing protein [Candidatus Minimicrobia naudis]|uniref:Prepilin-type N-terminal cleavage/methylation domain-containing protein n=2 Tax=Candidatus Saccharimonadota TaxID=95818 RepID=A0A8F1SB44_9BACT|nr:prepilin-type N-terminal cleavage/methylation domain-containing protein [Candidatus Minimicrobia naudis]
MNKRNGFTIIELLVVATFLIIIAILGFSQYTK